MRNAKSIPLRETKYAKTKLAILNEALKRITNRPLDDISVAELARSASVSEQTFYNYFPKKTDLLVYYIQHWTIDMAWLAKKERKNKSAIAKIESVFLNTANISAKNPSIMAEIVAYHAKRRSAPCPKALTRAEKILAHPEVEDVENSPEMGLPSIFFPLIAEAIKLGELPAKTNPKTVFMLLSSIFMGTPALIGAFDGNKLSDAYKIQLKLLWSAFKNEK